MVDVGDYRDISNAVVMGVFRGHAGACPGVLFRDAPEPDAKPPELFLSAALESIVPVGGGSFWPSTTALPVTGYSTTLIPMKGHGESRWGQVQKVSPNTETAARTWLDDLSPELFWDVRREDVNPRENLRWLVERILTHGRWNDWITLRLNTTDEDLRGVLARLKIPLPGTVFLEHRLEDTP